MQVAKTDLWERLQTTEKKVVLYGMGNGAEKLLAVLNERKIPVAGIFSSAGFSKGKDFCGIDVISFDELKATYGSENLVALLAFGSSRPDVMEQIERVASEVELYAPDLPVFGDTLFTKDFYNEHLDEMKAARSLLSDALSKTIFDEVIAREGEVPKPWQIKDINTIMNFSVIGWEKYKQKRFKKYGQQNSWKRKAGADGFMELPDDADNPFI